MGSLPSTEYVMRWKFPCCLSGKSPEETFASTREHISFPGHADECLLQWEGGTRLLANFCILQLIEACWLLLRGEVPSIWSVASTSPTMDTLHRKLSKGFSGRREEESRSIRCTGGCRNLVANAVVVNTVADVAEFELT